VISGVHLPDPNALPSTPTQPSECQAAQATFAASASALINRPLRDSSLGFNPLDYLIELCFYNYTADYHLAKRRMQGLEIEDQVKFAHVFKEAVEGLHKDLDEVEKGKRRFGRGTDHDEVESGVVTVGYERWCIVVRGGRSGGFGGAGEKRWEAAHVLDGRRSWTS
jgi:hypothetical protein